MGNENTNVPAAAPTNASNAEVLYGNPGGDSDPSLSSIDSAMESSGFGQIAHQARSDGKHEFAKEIDQTRRTLAGAFHELGFARDSATKIAVIVKDYWDSPRDKETAAKIFENTLEALDKKWGDQFETNLDGATELLGMLRRKDPAFGNFLAHTGMQNDERLLRILGETARHRKAKAKK